LSNGVFPFDEPVLTTYMDLDALIAATPLSKSERHIVGWLMKGHNADDIAEKMGTARQTVNVLFKRAVEKICNKDGDEWREVYA